MLEFEKAYSLWYTGTSNTTHSKDNIIMYLYIFEDTPFELGTWEVLMWFGAIVVLFLLTVNRPKNFPVGRLGIFLCGLMLAYFGFVGGKILSIILNWQEVSSKGYSLYEIYITSGGAFLGTLYTEILVLIAFTKCRRNKISFLVFSDYMAPFMLLAQAFVRVGCFFNECCYGKVTDLPWGCVFQTVSPEPRHPTQLYEVAYIVLIFLIMRHISVSYTHLTLPTKRIV